MNSTSTLISVVIPVYQDGAQATAAVRNLLLQSLPAGCKLEVVIVDDGSSDDTPRRLAQLVDDRIRIVRLPKNEGRSAARNAGVADARGQFVVFMDSDCVPVGDGFLRAHAKALESDAVASTGHVEGNGHGFWSRYQTEASERRSRQHAAGLQGSGSSQNLAVRRDAFKAVGGFDRNYRRYGFEDRDLLLRLSGLGPIAWAEEARVRHMDALTMAQVAAKMMEAGEFTSSLFAQRHPEAYRALGYQRVDFSQSRWRRAAGASSPLVLLAARTVDAALAWNWLPYRLKGLMVRVISGAAFVVGTSRRNVNDPHQ